MTNMPFRIFQIPEWTRPCKENARSEDLPRLVRHILSHHARTMLMLVEE